MPDWRTAGATHRSGTRASTAAPRRNADVTDREHAHGPLICYCSPPAMLHAGACNDPLPYDNDKSPWESGAMYQLPTEPLSIGRVLDSAIKLFASSFRLIAPLSAVVAVVAGLPLLIMLVINQSTPLIVKSPFFMSAY